MSFDIAICDVKTTTPTGRILRPVHESNEHEQTKHFACGQNQFIDSHGSWSEGGSGHRPCSDFRRANIPLQRSDQRNRERFPNDFMFQLTAEEFKSLTSQFAMLKKGRGQHRKFLPYAFTENGAIMAANVLNSPEAVRMSVFVVRAFVQMRELLGSTKELAKQLAALEKKLTARLDGHEVAIIDVLRRVMDILDPPPPPPEPERPKERLGFYVEPEQKSVTKAKKKT
jgi:hypothetical protein